MIAREAVLERLAARRRRLGVMSTRRRADVITEQRQRRAEILQLRLTIITPSVASGLAPDNEASYLVRRGVDGELVLRRALYIHHFHARAGQRQSIEAAGNAVSSLPVVLEAAVLPPVVRGGRPEIG